MYMLAPIGLGYKQGIQTAVRSPMHMRGETNHNGNLDWLVLHLHQGNL